MEGSTGNRALDTVLRLIDKLGHEVAEVRHRAMQNLVFKVKNGLVNISDLVQEHDLLANLLEWFNQRNELCSEALDLLLQFAQHPTSAMELIDIGGIDFLMQLEEHNRDVEEWGGEIRPVLEALLALPQSQQTSTPLASDHAGTESVVTSPRSSLHTVDGDALGPSRGPTTAPAERPDHVRRLESVSLPHDPVGHASLPNFLREELTRMTARPSPVVPEIAALPDPYYSAAALSDGGAAAVRTASDSNSALSILRLHCDELSDFQLVALSTTDQKILRATGLKLQDSTTALAACEFFKEVLLIDFPAEVFLQHTVILHGLIRLVGDTRSVLEEMGIIKEKALACLVDLASALHRRATNHDSHGGRKRVKRDLSRARPHSNPIGVLFFCHAVFVQAIPLLRDDETLAETVRVLSATLPLLAHASSVDDVTAEEARFHKENVVQECLAVLAAAVHFHLGQYYTDRRVVNLIQLMVRAVTDCVPRGPDEAGRYIPTELRTVLGRLSTDWTLGTSLEDVHQMLELYLPTIEFEFLDDFNKLEEIEVGLASVRQFLDGASQFVRLVGEPSRDDERAKINAEEREALLAEAVAGFPMLHFTRDGKFVEYAIAIAALAFRDDSGPETVDQVRARQVLRHALVFPITELRSRAYMYIEEGLRTRRPALIGLRRALTTTDSLYHLVAFGFDDSDETVATSARRLFVELTTLDVDNCAPPDVARSLRAVYPLLQCHVADEVVGRRVTLLISNTMMDPRVAPAETLAAGLRALLHTDASARRWGRDKLIRHVHLAPCRRFDEDLLFTAARTGRRDASHLAQSAIGWASHKELDATQLFDILSSSHLSIHLRLAAAEHLGLVLHHPQFHPVLIARGLLQVITDILRSCIPGRESVSTLTSEQLNNALACACMSIARLLIHYNADIREDVNQDHAPDSLLATCCLHVFGTETPDSRTVAAFSILVTVCVFDEAMMRSAAAARPNATFDNFLSRSGLAAHNDTFVHDPDDTPASDFHPGQPAIRLPRACVLAFELPVEVVVGTFRTDSYIAPPNLHPTFHPAVHEMWFVTCIGRQTDPSAEESEYNSIKHETKGLRADVKHYQERYPHLMPPAESVQLLQTLDTGARLRAALGRMQHAADHGAVGDALSTIEAYCIESNLGLDEFVKLPWHIAFSRYFSAPASAQDAALQTRLLVFCRAVALSQYATATDQAWLTEVTVPKLLDRLSDQPSQHVSWSAQQALLSSILDITEALLCNAANEAMTQTVVFNCAALLLPLFLKLQALTAQVDGRVLSRALRMLVHLTGPVGCNCGGFTTSQLLEISVELLHVIAANTETETLAGSIPGDSFLGSHLTSLATTAARHIADVLNERNVGPNADDDVPIWLWQGSISWVAGLCAHTADMVRVQGLGLLAAFLRSPAMRPKALEIRLPVRLGTLPLFEALVSIVYDLEECSAVRAGAVATLVNLGILAAQPETEGIEFFTEIEKNGLLSKIGWVLESAAEFGDLLEPLYVLLHNLLVTHKTLALSEISQAGSWAILSHQVSELWEHYQQHGVTAWGGVNRRLFELLELATRLDGVIGGEHAVALTLVENHGLLPSIFNSLSECFKTIIFEGTDIDTLKAVAGVNAACDFLTRLVRSPSTVPSILSYVTSHWHIVVVPIEALFAKGPLPSAESWDRWQAYGYFLLSLLEALNKDQADEIAQSLDEVDISQDNEFLLSTTGAQVLFKGRQTMGGLICERLLFTYLNSFGGNYGSTSAGIDVLSAILAVSESAKHHALKMGLLDAIAKDINEVHATLCMEGFKPGAETAVVPSAPATSHFRLAGSLKLLANALHNSISTKRQTSHRGLIGVLEPVWNLCALHDRTLRILLEVLCNLVSQCPDAARGLALPISNRQSLVVATAALGTKILSGRGHQSLTKVAFDLLTSFAATTESRNVLWKEGFLDECITRLPISKTLLPEVLQFLSVASLHKDVFNSLLRTPKHLGAIVLAVSTEERSSHALLILRNLCFVRSAYPMILKHRTCLAMLIAIGRQVDDPRRQLAIEALAALIHRCSKAERNMLWPRLAPVLEPSRKSLAVDPNDSVRSTSATT